MTRCSCDDTSGYASDGLQKNPAFFGDATSFVFRAKPSLGVYPSSGLNSNYLYFNLNTQTLENGLGMGGQSKHMAWWIDSDCHGGHSERSLTPLPPTRNDMNTPS